MKHIKKNVIFLVVLIIFVSAPTLAICQEEGFWSRISMWNPIRDKITEPLQGAIPNFELRGFIQNYNAISVHENVNSIRSWMTPTNTHTQAIEWLLDLEGKYRFTSNLWVTVKADFLYNAAYNWISNYEESYYGSREKLHYYKTAEDILREWYIDYINGPLQVRVGKQQVSWGKVDGRQILDMIHSFDYRRYPFSTINPFLSIEYLRVPKWMTNVKYYIGDYNVQFLWIPEFRPSIGPTLADSPWQFTSRIPSPFSTNIGNIKKPARTMGNSEWGFKLQMLKKGWDLSLHYLYAFHDSPTMFYTITAPPPTINISPQFTRLHKFGLGVDKTWAMCGRQWAAKFEGRYIKDRYYELNAAQYTPQNRGYTKLDSLLTGIQLETYFLTNLTAILRWDIETRMRWHDYIRDLPVGKNIDRCQNGVYLTLMKPIIATHNRLNLRSMLIWVEAGGWRYEPAITYELSECLELMLAGYLYWGNYDEINGQFTKHDGGSFGIKYSF